jgi:hypothetical protein
MPREHPPARVEARAPGRRRRAWSCTASTRRARSSGTRLARARRESPPDRSSDHWRNGR